MPPLWGGGIIMHHVATVNSTKHTHKNLGYERGQTKSGLVTFFCQHRSPHGHVGPDRWSSHTAVCWLTKSKSSLYIHKVGLPLEWSEYYTKCCLDWRRLRCRCTTSFVGVDIISAKKVTLSSALVGWFVCLFVFKQDYAKILNRFSQN